MKIIAIKEEANDTIITAKCCKPKMKETPWSNGHEELEQNNKLFQTYSDQYRQDMENYRKVISKLHLGFAIVEQKEYEKREN